MKKLKFLALAMVIFSAQFVEARENPVLPNESLRSEVIQLIGPMYFGDYQDTNLSVEVLFTINSNGELIVLDVDAPQSKVRSYFKRKLNYKKVNHLPSKPGEIFLLPVKVLVP
jgi:hypothetical protein